MSSKNIAVFGIYATAGTAEAAVDHLISQGFSNSAISVLLPDDESTRAFAHEKNTKAPEGTTTGVAAGGVIGGTLGLLAGIGALAIPGIGPFIAAGPIMAALAGVGVGGAVGGLVGALVGMGIPEYEARRYEGAVKGGGTLLSVHCDTSEQVASAKAALHDTGARDIASTGEAGAAGHRGHEDRTDRDRTDRDRIARDRMDRDRIASDPEDRDRDTYASGDTRRADRNVVDDDRERATYASERSGAVPPSGPNDPDYAADRAPDYAADRAATPRRY